MQSSCREIIFALPKVKISMTFICNNGASISWLIIPSISNLFFFAASWNFLIQNTYLWSEQHRPNITLRERFNLSPEGLRNQWLKGSLCHLESICFYNLPEEHHILTKPLSWNISIWTDFVRRILLHFTLISHSAFIVVEFRIQHNQRCCFLESISQNPDLLKIKKLLLRLISNCCERGTLHI